MLRHRERKVYARFVRRLHYTRISYDVQGAYLSADVERDVFVLPPPLSNCPEGFVYKLQGDVWLGGLGQGVTEEGSTCV